MLQWLSYKSGGLIDEMGGKGRTVEALVVLVAIIDWLKLVCRHHVNSV